MIKRSSLGWCAYAACALSLFGIVGCTPVVPGGGGGDGNVNDNGNANDNGGGGGDNQAPTANAGADQQVAGGEAVQLDGSGSSDPDGDTPTFAWSQTGGTAVTLTGADTATPSFTAPLVTDTLTFEVAIDDGNGGTDTDTVDIDVATEASVLFVVNNGDGITSYANPAAADGDVAPTTELPAGGVTGIFQPRSIAVTDQGVLLISSQNDAIVGYEDGFTATGELDVQRQIEGANTGLETPISFAYDRINDRLFVGNVNAPDGILVFDDVSNPSFNNDPEPNRTFGPDDRSPFAGPGVSITSTFDAMDFDSQGNLYVSDTSGTNVNQSRILVFAIPGEAEGPTAPIRSFTSSAWDQIEDLVVTDDDFLLVVDAKDSVCIFRDASTLSDQVSPDVSPSALLTVQADGPQLEGIVVDRNGVGYVADRANHAIYTFVGITSLDGTLPPNRTIEGNATELRSPRQMFLFEPE